MRDSNCFCCNVVIYAFCFGTRIVVELLHAGLPPLQVCLKCTGSKP